MTRRTTSSVLCHSLRWPTLMALRSRCNSARMRPRHRCCSDVSDPSEHPERSGNSTNARPEFTAMSPRAAATGPASAAEPLENIEFVLDRGFCLPLAVHSQHETIATPPHFPMAISMRADRRDFVWNNVPRFKEVWNQVGNAAVFHVHHVGGGVRGVRFLGGPVSHII